MDWFEGKQRDIIPHTSSGLLGTQLNLLQPQPTDVHGAEFGLSVVQTLIFILFILKLHEKKIVCLWI